MYKIVSYITWIKKYNPKIYNIHNYMNSKSTYKMNLLINNFKLFSHINIIDTNDIIPKNIVMNEINKTNTNASLYVYYKNYDTDMNYIEIWCKPM